MRFFLFFILFLLITTKADADFLLEPATLTPGGVAILCWQGMDSPHILSQVTFSGTRFPLVRRDNRLCALVGVDLDQPAGLWPLSIESVDPAGAKHLTHLALRVEGVERPAQRLTLPKQMVTPTKAKIVKQIESDRKRLDTVFKRRHPVLFSPPFLRPLTGEVISAFGLRRILNGIPKSSHNGIDFRAERGTPVIAMADGQVALAENLYYTGKTVIVDHGGGLFSLYAHLDTLAVTPETTVAAGKKIGTVGSTGRSTGPHLHMGTRLGKARIDPLALIALFADEKR